MVRDEDDFSSPEGPGVDHALLGVLLDVSGEEEVATSRAQEKGE